MVFYFITTNSTVATAGYPPFGLVSISFVPLSLFLTLIGLYHSAFSVANDLQLHRETKKSAIKEIKLLRCIREAEMEQ